MENKIIEWTLDDISGELRRISLVSSPAIEEEFMLFNSELENFKTIDEEKRVVTGVAMRPNMKIARRDENGELYYGYFSEETVVKAAEIFFQKASNTNNTNLEHQFEIDGVFVFESWIVEDPDLDKTKALGLSNIKKGDWVVSMKVTNDDVWKHFIKTGLVKGFSVEIKAESEDKLLAALSKIVKDDNLSEDEIIGKLKDVLGLKNPTKSK